jgi:hypothetical protein
MRKPLMTKKRSTPRNPPGIQEKSRWYRTTPTTAMVRSPSSAGRYGMRRSGRSGPALVTPTSRALSGRSGRSSTAKPPMGRTLEVSRSQYPSWESRRSRAAPSPSS